jgi:hypothetical protein
MDNQRLQRLALAFLLGWGLAPLSAADIPLEEQPNDPKQAKVVLIAGSNFFKPGEHEYIAGCSVLYDLLKQSPGVAPVLAVDWPAKPETLTGAKSVVFFFDGAEKSQLLKNDRLAQIQKLADAGVGTVHLHQVIDYPKELGERARALTGAAWEKGHSQRAHWVAEFKEFPKHEIFNGVSSFKIDDGWLFKLRFVPDMKGVAPLLKTVSPKAPADQAANDAIVAWAFERTGGGRAFTFTGCHLHASFAQEGYRKFLVNGILWSAGVEVPADGAPVKLAVEDMNKYLKKPEGKK